MEYNPIYGYQDVPIVTLEEAVKNLVIWVPGVENYAHQAKQHCYHNTDLALDESAAIYLYTMAIPFNDKLNSKLRAGNDEELKPWFPFLKLFITALTKLPSLAITVWGGINGDIRVSFVDNEVQTWWNINFCSKDLKVIECYLGDRGTLFTIETKYGKDISKYSAFPDEQEVVLMPGTRLYLINGPLNFKDQLNIIALKEC